MEARAMAGPVGR